MGGTKDNIGDLILPALPNISGEFTVDNGYWQGGAITVASETLKKNGATGDNGNQYQAKFDASRWSDVYSNDCKTVQPPAIKTIWCIQHTSTNTPAICMPKVNYKKVKIFRDKMSRSKLFI